MKSSLCCFFKKPKPLSIPLEKTRPLSHLIPAPQPDAAYPGPQNPTIVTKP
jgi:hypothetical protein